jgi:hypothetical protein
MLKNNLNWQQTTCLDVEVPFTKNTSTQLRLQVALCIQVIFNQSIFFKWFVATCASDFL